MNPSQSFVNDVNVESAIDVFSMSFLSLPPMNVSFPIKLDDINYMIWRDQLLIYVTTYGLEGLIDGSFVQSMKFLASLMSVNPTFLSWSMLNSILKGWVYGSISVSMLGYLSNGMTKREQ